MVPSDFNSFFVTCAQAAGALIGLLFVAVSINPQATVAEDAPVERQIVAASAFTALVNAFFISIGSQIPRSNVGLIVVLFGLIGFLNTLLLLRAAFQPQLTSRTRARALVMAAITGALYLAETWQGVLLIRTPSDFTPLYSLDGILIGVFGIGLIRAWELLGAKRYGFLAWLNPLRDVPSSRRPAAGADAVTAAGGRDASNGGQLPPTAIQERESIEE